MNRITVIILTVAMIGFGSAWAMDDMDHSGHKMKSTTGEGHQMAMPGHFTHEDTVDGVAATFEVMSLASMNMTDKEGNTHHIMVSLKDAETGKPIKKTIGKVKVIAPDKTETTGTFKDYGGMVAVNLTFNQSGNYGVICLLKNGDKKRVFKFWYPHKI